MRKTALSPRTLAGLGAGLGLLIACIAWFVPYLTRERENVSGVPVPPPLFVQDEVKLRPGSEACLSDVAFDTDAETVELTALRGRSPGPRLAIVAEGPRYRETTAVPDGYTPTTVLRADIDPPERSLLGTLCIANRGQRRVTLLGTTEARTVVARPMTQIDGTEVVPDIPVRFLSTDRGSVLERAGELVERVAAFKPGVFGVPAVLWLLLLLVAVGVPATAVYSIVSSFRDSD
jgi:hypothetical protein